MAPVCWLSTAAIALSVGVGAGAAAAQDTDAVRESVVQIIANERKPDFQRPWAKSPAAEVRGTGVVIDGKRILTNSHVVAYAGRILVQPYQSAEKFTARVDADGPEIDLATLKLEDESFFEHRPPLKRSKRLPQIKESILTYGYPEGGSSLAITRGIVSRIEFKSIDYQTLGLRMQIDAAINPGNSGGPAVIDNELVGLVFSHVPDADNIGYVIPTEEIELFLADIADGSYRGKPSLREGFASIENDALRGKLGLGKGVTGVVINDLDTARTSPLKKWDVITHIGDHAIDNIGMVQVSEHLRLPFPYYVQRLARDDKLPLTVIRDQHKLELSVPVAPGDPYVLGDLKGKYPAYFVYGPLVFSPATEDLVEFMERKEDWPDWFVDTHSPLLVRRYDVKATPDEEIVVVATPMFPHPVSKGYSDPFGMAVKSINDQPIRNMKELVRALVSCRDPYVTIEFHERHAEAIVMDRRAAEAATEEILNDNGIRSQCSDDLKPLLKP